METFDRAAIKMEAKQVLVRNRSQCIMMTLCVLVVEMVTVAVSAGILTALLNGLLVVTSAGFFVSCWRDTPITVSQAISETFDEGFLRKLGGMLWMDLKVFLWSLLFIIPGIIKSLSYAMTPYLLRDYPNIPAMDASVISERMMRGHRADVFIAQLSFLGWQLLGAMTFGILTVLFVEPYQQISMAGIFEEIKQLALDQGVVSQEELDGGLQRY